ncbi:MAG: hypothetical protein L0H29_09435 [Sinobacteraceae bacterium]|nr:hypothetical protein [Nevskiaceae bacterium]
MEQTGMAPGSAVPFVIPDARQRDPESSQYCFPAQKKPALLRAFYSLRDQGRGLRLFPVSGVTA